MAVNKIVVLVMAFLLCGSVSAQSLDGRTIISEVEKRLWGSSSQGRYEMTIATPYWQRTLVLQVWMQRPDRSFIRILSPAKEAGVGCVAHQR